MDFITIMQKGKTMIHWASENGLVQIIDALASVGANVNITDMVRMITPFLFSSVIVTVNLYIAVWMDATSCRIIAWTTAVHAASHRLWS